MDLVVSFYWGQGLAVECYKPLPSVHYRLLEQNSTHSKVRAVYLDIERFQVLR